MTVKQNLFYDIMLNNGENAMSQHRAWGYFKMGLQTTYKDLKSRYPLELRATFFGLQTTYKDLK